MCWSHSLHPAVNCLISHYKWLFCNLCQIKSLTLMNIQIWGEYRITECWFAVALFNQSCTIIKHLVFLCFRNFWSEVGGNSAVWTPVWEQACPYAGGAVCWFHSAVGPSGGGPIQAARTGKPGQRAAGCLWLWRETLLWLVRKHVSILAGGIYSDMYEWWLIKFCTCGIIRVLLLT